MEDKDLIKSLEEGLPARSCFWGHTWTVWGEVLRFERLFGYDVIEDHLQRRKCLKCGQIKTRKTYSRKVR